MKIYISGVHSGPNPSSGLGTARAIKAMFPEAELVAVDYSNRSSGIHHDVFDSVWLQSSWDLLDLNLYAQQIKDMTAAGAAWISSLDLEVHWMGQQKNPDTRILVAPFSQVKKTFKPQIEAHHKLPISVSPYLSADEPDWALNAFCRKYGWRVWLKGPYYEAWRVHSWAGFESIRNALSGMWSRGELYLQAHVAGLEESIAYSAYQGELLDCVYMHKRDVTYEGKTWAGRFQPMNEDFRKALARVVRDLNWTGGAELEFIRDSDNRLWLFDWNARFPAWIYGTALAGHNLPGLLAAKAFGEPVRPQPVIAPEFTRVVLEVPVRKGYPMPTVSEHTLLSYGVISMKHPSGMAELAHKLKEKREKKEAAQPKRQRQATSVAPEMAGELSKLCPIKTHTPRFLTFVESAREHFAVTHKVAQCVSKTTGVSVRVAYSIKTNPDRELIKAAKDVGLLAEAISTGEARHALSLGFAENEIVLNGPNKFCHCELNQPIAPLRTIFADSIKELTWLQRTASADTLVGIRLRPAGIPSRFGIPLETPEQYAALVKAVKATRRKEFGVHCHFASSSTGASRWLGMMDSTLEWATNLQKDSGKQVVCLDMGGGWSPDDWTTEFMPRLEEVVAKAKAQLPALREVLLEPGKALLQPHGALLTRIVERRTYSNGSQDIVVDGAISDLPDLWSHPHRLVVQSASGKWVQLNRGKDRVLGRICMETDILAIAVDIPRKLKAGDFLVFCDAGGYDRSMSYDFGKGNVRSN